MGDGHVPHGAGLYVGDGNVSKRPLRRCCLLTPLASILADQCTFVDKPSQAVRTHLQQNLKGQERAVESVVGAIEAWEFSCVALVLLGGIRG